MSIIPFAGSVLNMAVLFYKNGHLLAWMSILAKYKALSHSWMFIIAMHKPFGVLKMRVLATHNALGVSKMPILATHNARIFLGMPVIGEHKPFGVSKMPVLVTQKTCIFFVDAHFSHTHMPRSFENATLVYSVSPVSYKNFQ